jgi:hypothetical protein
MSQGLFAPFSRGEMPPFHEGRRPLGEMKNQDQDRVFISVCLVEACGTQDQDRVFISVCLVGACGTH